MKARRIVCLSLCSLAILLVTGCAWQQIPPRPFFDTAESIPLRVGVAVLGDRSAVKNAETIIKHLNKAAVFQALHYPVKKSDELDATLTMSVEGAWHVAERKNNKARFLVGLTLGALRPWMGLSMMGHFNLEAELNVGTRSVRRYAVTEESLVQWAVGGDEVRVAYEAQEVEMQWLAWKLAQRLQADWPQLAKEIGK